ncbi:putative ribonuclease H-like domain-containing protein [Tanacetum coccineum]
MLQNHYSALLSMSIFQRSGASEKQQQQELPELKSESKGWKVYLNNAPLGHVGELLLALAEWLEAVVTMYNFQQYCHISPPGWTLGWTWAKKEVIWAMMGAQTTERRLFKNGRLGLIAIEKADYETNYYKPKKWKLCPVAFAAFSNVIERSSDQVSFRLFDIESLTKSMNYVAVVVAGTSSTNISSTKEDAMEQNVSTLRFIALPNWFYEAQMATFIDSSRKNDAVSEKDDSQKEQDKVISNSDASESSWNTNPTATTKDPTANQVEPVLSSIVETEVPTISSPVPTDSLSNPPIIGPVDTPVQTRQKTKNMEEQSFIATIHQKTNPKLLQYCLFSCFLSKEEPKKIFDALKDPSWVEAMQEELLQFKIQNVWVLVDYKEKQWIKGYKNY